MTLPHARFEDGRLIVEAASYTLVQRRAGRPFLRLSGADGRTWGDLAALGSADTLEGQDEWWAVEEPAIEPEAEGIRITWRVRSPRWEACRLVLRVAADRLAFRLEVVGQGTLTDVRLLGGRGSAWPGMDSGRLWSSRWFDSLVPGGPDAPGRIVAPAAQAAASSACGSGQPAGGRWFFTPGPLAFAAARDASDDPGRLPPAPWLGIGLEVAGVQAATFTQLAWEADDRGFDLRIDYEGHTVVDGSWVSPWAVLVPDAADPYRAIAAAGGRALEAAPPPSWWLEPMFCGWGAQWAQAIERDTPPGAGSTQANYDAWLARLAAAGIEPGTIVIDDKWQRTYGANEPDPERWPDLAGWIAARHAEGRRVLLWWKAWDAEGLPPDWCVHDGDARPRVADPTNPAYAQALDGTIARLLAPPDRGGLGADGLKIDFTASTPSGAGLRTWADEHAAPDRPWGIALLHRLLTIVASAARRERPDALLVTHTPNPLLHDVLSMVRLNDALRLDDPEPFVPVIAQLRHRAALVRAVLPGVPIDTDDWAMPSRAEWRAWLRAKAAEGVPVLYHVDGLGTTTERLDDDDLRQVATEWERYRARVGLPAPAPRVR